jgi:hypothetical protein
VPSVDFGHLYKFLASVGLVLIVAAFLVPWAFVQANEALLVTNQDLAGLTPTAREILIDRQGAIERVQTWMPWISLAILLAGLACLITGFNGWRKRQKASDEGEDLDLQNKRQAVAVPMTDSEVDEKLQSEAESDSPPPVPANTATSPAQSPESADQRRRIRMDDLRASEARLAQLAAEAFEGFRVTSNVRVSGPGEDAPRNSRVLDVLISPEIESPWGQLGLDLKRVSMSPTVAPAMVNLAISALYLQRGSVYTGSRGRPRFTECAAVLLYVFDDEHQVASAKERMRSDFALVNEALKQPVGVVALPKSTFDQLKPVDMRRLLATAWLGEFVLG